jgi:MFS family permease
MSTQTGLVIRALARGQKLGPIAREIGPMDREIRPLAGRLPAGAAFALQVSVVVFFLAASAAPTPLYALYQTRWGFSPITTTIVFGVYAVAVLAALLTVGSLSDHIGRRPVLLAALAGQAAAMVVFATAAGVPELMAARVIQGLATGAAAGAVGAGLLDLHRTRGTLANAVEPITGTPPARSGRAAGRYRSRRLVYLVCWRSSPPRRWACC